MIYFKTDNGVLYNGDVLNELKKLPDEYVNMCVTSPPYWSLRDYEVDGQVGLEKSPEEYVLKLVKIFREVRRVLKNDGTLWLNLGDTYSNHKDCKSTACVIKKGDSYSRDTKLLKQAGLKNKDLIGIPWMVAFALRTDGWYLRQDIIWQKPNPMPESVRDRCTKSHEYMFLLSKSSKYYYDDKAIQEPAAYDGRKDTVMKGSEKYKTSVVPGKKEHTMAAQGHERWQWVDGIAMKNKRSVWTVNIKPYKEAHFAVFPEKLIKPCILAGCPVNGIVIDPFFGSGTSGNVSEKLDRKWIGIDLNKKYCKLAKERITIISRPKDGIKLFF